MSVQAIENLRDFRGLLVQEQNLSLRQRAERDFSFFCSEFTSHPLADHHYRWLKFMQRDPEIEKLLLGPRGSAKTNVFSIKKKAWRSLKDPNQRGLIVMNTDFMVKRVMRDIKRLLMSEKVRSTWGDVHGEKWTENEITLAGRTESHKEATITGLSYGSAILSGHFDWILMDDVVTEENARSQLQRDKGWDWLRFTLLPCLEPGGELQIVGTRYHWDDLYGRFQDPSQWRSEIRVMIEKAIKDDGSSYWKEWYPDKLLQKILAQLGPIIFNAQYQNDVEAMKGSIFKGKWFRRYKILPQGLRRFQGVDLAVGQEEIHDYFADVTIGLDKDSNIYVIGEFMDRLDADDQLQAVKDQFDYYDKSRSPVLRVGIESNQYQATLAQRVIKHTLIPVKKIHHHKDKTVRAQRIQPHFKNGKVHFPMQGTEKLEYQLEVFDPNNTDKKDLMDAFMTAMEAAGKGGRHPARMGRKPKGY